MQLMSLFFAKGKPELTAIPSMTVNIDQQLDTPYSQFYPLISKTPSSTPLLSNSPSVKMDTT